MAAPPSIDRLRELLSVDAETGTLRWRVKRQGTVGIGLGSTAGRVSPLGYINLCVDGRTLLAHRVVFALLHGRWPQACIDHINGVRDDNRPCNLREASRAINAQNQRRAQVGSRSGLLGVQPSGRKWRADIRIAGRDFYLGTHETKGAAHAAYVEAKQRLHEGNTLAMPENRND